MTDLSTLTHDHFAGCINTAFTLSLDQGASLEMQLSEVVTRGSFDPSLHKRQAFALCFTGPSEPVLSQGIYSLSNPRLGELDLFLVPVGRTDQGLLYEAVFT